MPRLLIVDDRDATVEMCHRHLPQYDYVTRCDRRIPCQVCEERERGCTLMCAHDYQEAAETLARLPALPDLVVLDLHFALREERLLPEEKNELPTDPLARRHAVEELRRRQGILILERLRRDYPTLPVIMLTATGQEAAVGDPMVYFCRNEIVDARSLTGEIERTLELHQGVQEGPIFWGESRPMAELRRSLATLARSPLPLLLSGETGTGKSFLAEHFIHPRSGAKGLLVTTDLSTIPPTLLPAHLFGAKRGAYTGAVDDHAGVFEQAHGGTLFLDEIANLDLDLQRQLLLVLERGQVTRLGEAKPRPAQPKLVAATHADLEQLVRDGRFRADLYMRLSPATTLRVPPLRERRTDLPALVRFALLEALRSEGLRPLVRAFLARFPTVEDFHDEENSVVFARPASEKASPRAFTVFLSKRSLDRFERHDWPGNLRELRMLTTSALVFALVRALETPEAKGATPPRAPALLDLPDALIDRLLPVSSRAPIAATPRPAGDGDGRPVEVEVRPGPSFAKISADVEKQYLSALFRAAGGDLDRMARDLLGPGATGRRVHLRLNQLGLKLRELRGDKR